MSEAMQLPVLLCWGFGQRTLHALLKQLVAYGAKTLMMLYVGMKGEAREQLCHLHHVMQEKEAMTQRWHSWQQEQQVLMQRQLHDREQQVTSSSAQTISP